MARLGKLVKTLKIGIGTATDFLKSKGFEVEEDFNSKLTGEQEALLLKEFATPEMLSDFEAQKKESKKVKVEEPKKEEKKPVDKPDADKPQVKVVAKIDLDALNKPKTEKKEEPKVENKVENKKEEVKKEEPKKEVVQAKTESKKEDKKSESKPQQIETQKSPKPTEKENLAKENKSEKVVAKSEPKVAEASIAEPKKEAPKSVEDPKPEKKEDEIFTYRKVEFKSDIKVLDKIDLSTINNSTIKCANLFEQSINIVLVVLKSVIILMSSNI